MKNYEKIHVWDFHPTLTFIGLKEDFRKDLFKELKNNYKSIKDLLKNLNKSAIKYRIKRNYNAAHIYSWIKGYKKDRGKIKNINIPLWLLIEISKILSGNNKKDNKVMRKIEKNIECYTKSGKSNKISNPKLPLYLTPEMFSIIFHFMGDGHIGRKNVASSYRQMNKIGLNNFLEKLKNVFGDFNYSKGEFNNGRLNIPKIITDFYLHYFKLPSTKTFDSYIPHHLKSFEKEFLVSGLISFIIDEGHVGEVITIYCKNKRLIDDIKEIAVKCGYLCHPIREKYAYGKFDVYRFSISSKSYNQLYKDMINLTKLFPTCSLAQKTNRLMKRIR